MAWPHDLRTPTNPNAPEPVGWCDRGYHKWPLAQLAWQFDQRGNAIVNIGIRVCPRCMDEVATILAPVIIQGPEGVVLDPRPPQYQANFAGGVAAPTAANPIYPNGIPFPAGGNPISPQLTTDEGQFVISDEGAPILFGDPSEIPDDE